MNPIESGWRITGERIAELETQRDVLLQTLKALRIAAIRRKTARDNPGWISAIWLEARIDRAIAEVEGKQP